jgi:hypothetical protein
MDFRSFKKSQPVERVFDALGFSGHLRAAQSWDQLRCLVAEQNGQDNGGYVNAAQDYAGKCSSGERVLLHAILYATDFAWLADELDDGRTWRRLNYVSGDHRKAVIACMQCN